MSSEFDQAFERILSKRKPAPPRAPSRDDRIVAYCSTWRTLYEIQHALSLTESPTYKRTMKLVRSGHLEARRVGGGPERVRWEVRAT